METKINTVGHKSTYAAISSQITVDSASQVGLTWMPTQIYHMENFSEKSEIYKTQAVLFLFQILRSLKIKYNSLCLIQLFSYIYPKNHELNVEIFSLFPKSRMEESEFKFNRWIILFYRNQ